MTTESSQPQPVHTTSDLPASLIMGVARAIAAQEMPYFGAAISRLIGVPVPGLRTAGMSQWGHLLYDPEQMVTWYEQAGGSQGGGIMVLAGVVGHELLHYVFDHHARRGLRDPKIWNYAADIAINQIIREAELPLPPGALYHEAFQDATGAPFPPDASADEYYDLLVASGFQPPEPQPGEGAAGACGSGAGGDPLPGEPTGYDDPEVGGMGPEAQEAFRARAAQEVQAWKASGQGGGRGSVPGGLDRWSGEFLQPKPIPFHIRAGRAVRPMLESARGRGGRNFRRPSRRQSCMMGSDAPLLAVRHSVAIVVWFAIDTSGSMSEDQLSLGLGALEQLCRETSGVSVEVFACDAGIQSKPVAVKRWQDAVAQVKGGGGTDFHPIFEMYEKTPADRRPSMICVWTDGDGAAPTQAPKGVDVLWLLTSSYGEPRTPASWGKAILVEKPAAA